MIYTEQTKKALKLCFEAHNEQTATITMTILWKSTISAGEAARKLADRVEFFKKTVNV